MTLTVKSGFQVATLETETEIWYTLMQSKVEITRQTTHSIKAKVVTSNARKNKLRRVLFNMYSNGNNELNETANVNRNSISIRKIICKPRKKI